MTFNIDDYAHCFKTDTNKAYFWHGQTTNENGTYQSVSTARRLAEENGGKTITMCMIEHREELENAGVATFDDKFDWKGNFLETRVYSNHWDDCIRLFSEQASGDIHVVEGTDPRIVERIFFKDRIVSEMDYKQNYWAKIERPILTTKKNEKVKKIISHDAITGMEQKIIFNRELDRQRHEWQQRQELERAQRKTRTKKLKWSFRSVFTDSLWTVFGPAIKVAGVAAYLGIQALVSARDFDSPTDRGKIPTAQPLEMQNATGFVFGENFCKCENGREHIMIVGGIGSGKSTAIAIPSLQIWNERVFVIDIKGELYEATKDNPKRNIKLFNPMDIDTLGYDPFYLLKNFENRAEEARAIAFALIPMPPDTKQPYWINSARSLFTGAILHYYNLGYSFLKTVEKILDTPVDELVNEIYYGVPQRPSDPSEWGITDVKARRFVGRFVDVDLEHLSSVVSQLSTNIEVFATNDRIMNCLSKKENITPGDLEDGKDVYIHIPENLIKQWKDLLTLMVSQFLTHFEKRTEKEPNPILFLLDEFPRLGKMEGIIDGLATLRSKNITIAIFLQSLAQLDLIYGKEAREVIAETCPYKVVLNATSPDTQEYFSKMVGTYDRIKTSNNISYLGIGIKTGMGESEYMEKTRRIEPHEFATFEKTAILLTARYGVFEVVKKYYWKEDAITVGTERQHDENLGNSMTELAYSYLGKTRVRGG